MVGADPFLAQMSINGRTVAGNDIRSLKQQRLVQVKRVLPWGADEMQKAKSCDEMLQFEKPDPQADKTWLPYAYTLPNMSILMDFEDSLNKFIA